MILKYFSAFQKIKYSLQDYPIRNHKGDTGTIPCIMTAQAASRSPKDHPAKKGGRSQTKDRKDGLYAVAEHSLSGFLDSEPDIYTVADVKVRYR